MPVRARWRAGRPRSQAQDECLPPDVNRVTIQVIPAPAGARGLQPPQNLETPGGATSLLTTPPERFREQVQSFVLYTRYDFCGILEQVLEFVEAIICNASPRITFPVHNGS